MGDDIRKTRIIERLSRLGYVRSPAVVTGPGQWSQSGSRFHIHLKYCPIRGRGIVNGPVSFSLDLNTIRSVHLARSLQQVESLILEPELINVVSPRGSPQMLCRPVPRGGVPPLLVDAVILTEDRRFFSHHGIDPGSMFRALKTNVKAWRYVQGASTITQQLIRMTLLTPQKTLLRKTNEVFLALIADTLYSKQTILSAYLDRVYLGHWGQYPINGVTKPLDISLARSCRGLTRRVCISCSYHHGTQHNYTAASSEESPHKAQHDSRPPSQGRKDLQRRIPKGSVHPRANSKTRPGTGSSHGFR